MLKKAHTNRKQKGMMIIISFSVILNLCLKLSYVPSVVLNLKSSSIPTEEGREGVSFSDLTSSMIKIALYMPPKATVTLGAPSLCLVFSVKQLFSTFSVHYPSITEYRFGRPATTIYMKHALFI